MTELIVVIAVMGFVTAIAVITVRGVRYDAATATCATERHVLEQAVTAWTQRSDDIVTMERLVEEGIIRGGSHHFDVTPDGVVVARDAGDCAGAEQPRRTGPAGAVDSATPGAASSEPIEIMLAWTGNADADIWVRPPTGDVLGWTAPAAAGGWLDLDVIPSTPDEMGPHVERVIWPAGAAPLGAYEAWASFETSGWGPQDIATYTVTIRAGETVLAAVEGAVGAAGSVGTPVSALLAA